MKIDEALQKVLSLLPNEGSDKKNASEQILNNSQRSKPGDTVELSRTIRSLATAMSLNNNSHKSPKTKITDAQEPVRSPKHTHISFHPETVFFRPGGVNLRAYLCGVLMYASAQPLDFLARTKNPSFTNWKPLVSHP